MVSDVTAVARARAVSASADWEELSIGSATERDTGEWWMQMTNSETRVSTYIGAIQSTHLSGGQASQSLYPSLVCPL